MKKEYHLPKNYQKNVNIVLSIIIFLFSNSIYSQLENDFCSKMSNSSDLINVHWVSPYFNNNEIINVEENFVELIFKLDYLDSPNFKISKVYICHNDEIISTYDVDKNDDYIIERKVFNLKLDNRFTVIVSIDNGNLIHTSSRLNVHFENFQNLDVPQEIGPSFKGSENDSSNSEVKGDYVKHARYHAIIIGMQNYDDKRLMKGKRKLKYPISYAEKMKSILENKFEFNTIIPLIDPTVNDVFNELKKFKANNYNHRDNLLIFYSGHGYLDDDEEGYWILKDSKYKDKSSYLNFSKFKKELSDVRSQHILLILDNCHAGAIFKRTKSGYRESDRRVANSITKQTYQNMYLYKSRRAWVAGSSKHTVPDKSKFIEEVFKHLNGSSGKGLNKDYFVVSEVAGNIKFLVINKDKIIPEYNFIDGLGDQGGEFVFKKKRN